MKASNKLLVILIVIIICGLIFISSSEKFVEQEYDISRIIGEEYTGGDVTLQEYIILSEKTIGTYFKYLRNQDFEKAYALLTPEYKAYVPYEKYIEDMKNADFSSCQFKDIVMKTENMYEVFIEMSGDIETNYLIIFNDDKFALAPEEFLKYEVYDEKIEKDNVEYTLSGYKVELNKCTFDVTINNKNNEEIKISSAKMITTKGGTMKSENAIFKVQPNTSVSLPIEISTSIDFPSEFQIERDAGNSIKTYVFKLE